MDPPLPPPKDDRPELVRTPQAMYEAVAAARRAGRRVGLVPTMGALHEGHLSLVRASLAECDVTVVTLFVNPTQFGPNEDLATYPRTLAKDRRALAELGVDYLFAPDAEAMYPPGYSTYVEPPAVARPLEGECRPGHFRGVATVVLKLFHIAPADKAYFGAKDYQQALVIRRMVDDLNVPIQIEVLPTVREPDGLAMSSRNRYLGEEEREQALALWRSLNAAASLVGKGERDAAVIEEAMRRVFAQAGVREVDYAVVVDPATLEPVRRIDGPVLAAVAARVGPARLIDNLLLRP